jgi:hypothetical protein
MSGFGLIAQAAIFAALNGQIGAPVKDDPTPLPAGQPDSGFPYLVIGNDTERPWDHDGRLGADVTVTLHVWSRKPSFAEAKTIAAAIYGKLHRKPILAVGARVVDCLHEFSDFARDDDGKTRHGVVRYRLTMQEL